MDTAIWNKIRENRFAPDPTPAEWPRDVRALSIDGMSLFGVDSNNRLFWDGKKIRIERRLRLNPVQSLAVILGGLGAFASGAWDVWQWLLMP